MKRLIAVLSGLLVLPAFAEVAPISYDEIVEYSETEMVEPDAAETAEEEVKVITPVAQPSKASPRGTASSRAASRAVPSTTKSVNSRSVSARSTASSRNATQARTGTITAARNAVSSRGTTSRVAARPSRNATTAATGVTSRRAADTNQTVAARAGSLTQTDTVNTPLYTGRVGMRTSANIQSRMRSSSAIGLTGLSAATDNALSELTDIDELAQNTAYCKAQYTSCMDNFCNVLDDNQGRCSCSKNLKNYAKTEEALKQATIALEEVAQQIRYIGLSADQIETLFAETEAEIALSDSKNNDNSDITNQLAKIKKIIIEIEPGSASTTSTGINIDLNGLLDFGDLTSGFDFSSLNLFSTTNKNDSISNQRGEQLYKTAAARCKTAVLDTCASQGVDTSIITNSYDLEIDKQCIAYERNLTEANETMASTVRNAKTVLQNARLMVAQQKNAYTLRECVEQLDVCMREDFVCGDDYENCLDPTGRYIAGGKIVLGSTPGQSTVSDVPQNTLYATWNYTSKDTNADRYTWGPNGTLGEYIDAYMTDKDEPLKKGLEYMANYLRSKIGYIDDTGKAVGLCSGVLNQCQDYTYTTDGKTRSATKKYNPDNQVIRNYLERTLVQVKAAQDTLVEEYAEDCITQEVSTCLNQNDFDETHSKTALLACKQQITTCMSVNGEKPDKDGGFSDEKMKDWVLSITGETDTAVSDYRYTQNCVISNGTVAKDSDDKLTCTCGANATAAGDGSCYCNTGYSLYNGVCTNVKKISCETSGGTWKTSTRPSSCVCPDLMSANSSGECVAVANASCDDDNKCSCVKGYTEFNGTCVNTGNYEACTSSGGAWSDAGCKCPDGKSMDTSTGQCQENQ